MKFIHIAVATFLSTSLAAPVFAQPGPGSGPGMGPSTGMGGKGGKAAHFAWNKGNIAGWSLMTAEERADHQAKMRAVTTYDECKVLQEEQRKTMEARAVEKGVKLPAPRQNGCDRMKARGILK